MIQQAGNQTATIVSLACLKDHDLTTEVNQLAIKDIGGLEVLINLLETEEMKCKVSTLLSAVDFFCAGLTKSSVNFQLGALYVLREITVSYDVRKSFTDLGGVPLLIEILSDQARDLKILAAETLANVARIRKARVIVRKCGGIPKIVSFSSVCRRRTDYTITETM